MGLTTLSIASALCWDPRSEGSLFQAIAEAILRFPNSAVLLWYALLKSFCELCKLHTLFFKKKNKFMLFGV